MKNTCEILESDRFDCVVINVIDTMGYLGVTIEEPYSKGRVYFGKVMPENDIKVGDVLYIGAKPLGDETDRRGSMEVYLYDADGNKLDWTMIY